MTNKERVQLTLGYTDKGYSLMIEYAGYNWLEAHFEDAQLKQRYVASPEFWQWWVNQWKLRDHQFLIESSLRYISEPLEGFELQLALELFVDKHNIHRLNIQPNRWVREAVQKEIALEELKLKVLQESKPKK